MSKLALIVTPNETKRRVMAQVAADLGYDLLAPTTFSGALDDAKQLPFDLLIIDDSTLGYNPREKELIGKYRGMNGVASLARLNDGGVVISLGDSPVWEIALEREFKFPVINNGVAGIGSEYGQSSKAVNNMYFFHFGKFEIE